MLWFFGAYQAFKVSVTAHEPETLRSSDNCCAPLDALKRARHPLLPCPFREPGLDRAATGQARVLWGGPLGDTGKVPNRVCDR